MNTHSIQDSDNLRTKLASRREASDLAARFFDFCMRQPLGRFLSPERVLARLEHFVSGPAVPAFLDRHLRPALDREAGRSEADPQRVEEFLTGHARSELDDITGRPFQPDPAFLEGLMRQEAVRQLVRAIVVETIGRFVKNLRGDGGGLLGHVGKLGVAKGLLSKVGNQIEARLQDAAAAFVQGSLDLVMKTVVATLSSPEMAGHLGELAREGFRALGRLETRVLWRAAMRQPVDRILALVPGLLRHNLGRESVRGSILAEVAAALDTEKNRTLGEIVDDAPLLDRWREETAEVGGSLISEFAATESFLDWLARED